MHHMEVSKILFNSIEFGIFFPIVFIVYWLLPQKHRWLFILISSYYFYMSWNAKYVFLILFTTVVSYLSALLIERVSSRNVRKYILTGCIVLCMGVLFFFKYFNFFSESVSWTLARLSIPVQPLTLKLMLPVGISFYTFQTMSYVIDVYRGQEAAEHHFGQYAAFVSFFPQLVAGPIERTGNLLQQIKDKHVFRYEQAAYGLKLMAWGFFKKVAIADTISQFAGAVFASPQSFHGFSLVIAAVLFSFQIYCDFSGYSDIAIGTAKMMGIELMTNFKSPYLSQSIKEFWSRWHISLSTWFRDYVYIPLGGSRVGKLRHYRNLLITFLVSGLWHGANWTFVIWGGIHGLAQIVENMLIPKSKLHSVGITRWLRILGVFAFCVIGWIFFASNSVSDAVYILTHLFSGIQQPVQYLRAGFTALNMRLGDLAQLAICIVILLAYDTAALKTDCIARISKLPVFVRFLIYILAVYLILFFRAGVAADFVYFQF